MTDISVAGDNDIATNGFVIHVKGSGTIAMTGDGFFRGESDQSSGLSMDGSAGFVFDVSDAVVLIGKDKGIWGNGMVSSSSIVTLKNNSGGSNYYFKGVDGGAVYNVADLRLDGMDFFYNGDVGTPGCYFDNKSVRQNGGQVVMGDDFVNFFCVRKNYGVTVAGVPLNNCNRAALGSKYIIGGGPAAVSFDESKNELVLNNATIAYDGADLNFNALKADGVGVRLVGDNAVTTSGLVAVEIGGGTAGKPVTTKVTGDGSVDVADIATVISVMAGEALEHKAAADVNKDGSVDVADISTIIDAMAGKAA